MKMHRIKEVLEAKSINKAALARQVGISDTALYAICENRSQPKLDTFLKIAFALGVPVTELLEPNPVFDDEPKTGAAAE